MSTDRETAVDLAIELEERGENVTRTASIDIIERALAAAREEGRKEEREAIARWMQGEHNPPCHEREHLPGATTVGTCRNCSIAAAIRARNTEGT